MKPDDYITIQDLTAVEVSEVLALAGDMSTESERFAGSLERKVLALIFEKPSLRTRTTFEVAMAKLSGQSIYLAPADIGLGKRESVPDVAQCLSRWVDVIAARTFAHSTVEELAEHSDKPVINALSDLYHPCQALADFMTLQQHLGDVRGKRLAYVGDGNNVAHSLMLAGPRVGMDVVIVTPEGYAPDPDVLASARKAAADADTKVDVAHEITAVEGSDGVYTDVWASMGQEEEAEERKRIFMPYQVNAELMAMARPGAIFLHCLPAHRGEEVTAEVADGEHSKIFDQAENRLWTQMAILYLLVRGSAQ